MVSSSLVTFLPESEKTPGQSPVSAHCCTPCTLHMLRVAAHLTSYILHPSACIAHLLRHGPEHAAAGNVGSHGGGNADNNATHAGTTANFAVPRVSRAITRASRTAERHGRGGAGRGREGGLSSQSSDLLRRQFLLCVSHHRRRSPDLAG